MPNLLEFAEAGLKTDLNTVRLHQKRNTDTIHESVSDTGFGRSILIDEQGQVLAGKGVVLEAEKRGSKILIVDADGDTLVAVRRSGMTDRQKTRAMLWDNQASDTSRNDKNAINRLAQENPTQRLLEGIFNEKEQAKILKATADAQDMAEGGIDDEDDPGPEFATAGQSPGSSIRMVSLFLTTENQPSFIRRLKALFPLFGATNNTDAVVAVVNRAYDEWVVAAANAPDEIANIVPAEESLGLADLTEAEAGPQDDIDADVNNW